MISVQEASLFFKQHLQLKAALLSKPIEADRDYPPYDRVMMDGIAVSFEAFLKGKRSFMIQGVQAAGEVAKTLLDTDHCFEVMTGALLPLQTDLVIPYEHLEISQGLAKIIKMVDRSQFENVHLQGSDCKAREVILREGARLNGPHQGIAASMGESFTLSTPSKILVVSTGDELVDVHETPGAHQIRRSNSYALKSSLEINGHTQVTLHHLNDDAKSIAEHYQKYSPDFDVMIYSGGVSKGKFDYLPNVWSDMGVQKHFHEVSQRPGKPLWFGTDEKTRTAVIGLPGNPVSGLVCLHRYLIPGKKMFAKLAEEVVFKKELTYFLPAKIEFHPDGTLWARPLKIKNSGEFTALAESDGFIELPAESSVFGVGEAFAFWPWRNL
jgi:molybdopterin molybdotransferase